MKLFDEKGKLFGKINIIDLLVILVVLVALVVVGMKVLNIGGNADTPPSSSPTDGNGDALSQLLSGECKLTYTVRATAQRKEIAEQLATYVDLAKGKKDPLMHGGELVEDAYVVDFWTEPCHYNMTSTGAVEMIPAAEAEAAGLVDICLVVEGIAPNAITSKVGSLEVRIGKPHILKTPHMEFINGIIVDCVWGPVEE